MLAPTHITGPDGTKCRKGEKIPDDWFEAMPDLTDHLAAIEGVGGDGAIAEPPETETVSADMAVKRSRSSS